MLNRLPLTEAHTCPCCGGPIGEAAPIAAVIDAEKSWVSKAILEVLSRPVGKRVRRDAIIEAIYQLEDEPETAEQVFRTTMTGLRKRIEAFGWMIKREGSKGPQRSSGSLYRLIPIGGEA